MEDLPNFGEGFNWLDLGEFIISQDFSPEFAPDLGDDSSLLPGPLLTETEIINIARYGENSTVLYEHPEIEIIDPDDLELKPMTLEFINNKRISGLARVAIQSNRIQSN